MSKWPWPFNGKIYKEKSILHWFFQSILKLIYTFLMTNLKRSFFSHVNKYQDDHPSSERGCAFVAVYIHALQNALSGLLIYVELSMKRCSWTAKIYHFIDYLNRTVTINFMIHLTNLFFIFFSNKIDGITNNATWFRGNSQRLFCVSG